MVTLLALSRILPSIRPSMMRSSSPVTSPLMAIDGPMVATPRERGGAAAGRAAGGGAVDCADCTGGGVGAAGGGGAYSDSFFFHTLIDLSFLGGAQTYSKPCIGVKDESHTSSHSGANFSIDATDRAAA